MKRRRSFVVSCLLVAVWAGSACGGASDSDRDACADDPKACESACDIVTDATCMRCEAPQAPDGLRVTLPADEGSHAEDLEWWYWTGHLQATDGRWFGFQQTVFLSSMGSMWGQVGHRTITDIDDASFHFTDSYVIGRPATVTGGFDFTLPGMTARGRDGRDVLHAEVDGYVLDLSLYTEKPVVYQHAVGYTDYDFGGNTYYFSRERMVAVGTVATGTETLEVRGEAWFDHQWGALTQAGELGWDWFALQLDDGREVMLFWVRDDGGDLLVGGSLAGADCGITQLAGSDVAVVATGSWTSPTSAKTYPMGWDVTVLGEVFHVAPVLEDQELVDMLPGITYWEGACTVSGAATGRAYVELTGY